mmetsp:Transcript_35767/g.102810  ORF Transcript_35767/g.102810 Transcript_35767/m.102810 type:complete len:132 (-) Transcript_35767:155-550(-)
MARVALVSALALLALVAVTAEVEAEAVKESTADTKMAFASPMAAAPVVGSLRATAATTLEDVGIQPQKPAPVMALGARLNFGVLIGLPIVLLFGMYAAKTMGGFYPNAAVCFIVMLIFVYTMVKSPYSYFV